jgi:hypothetical protein
MAVSNVQYALLQAASDEDEEVDSGHFQTPEARILNVQAAEVRHDKVATIVDKSRTRLRHSRQSVIIPGAVTRFEQDMIFMISKFSGTYTTEAGKYFVEKRSRVADFGDFSVPERRREISGIIMWPTDEPDVMESVNGDFCSDVNWIFAFCGGYEVEGTAMPISVTIVGSLHPLSPSPKYSELYSEVTMVRPENYMEPMGEILHAATAALAGWRKSARKECYQLLFIFGLFIGVAALECCIAYLLHHQ